MKNTNAFIETVTVASDIFSLGKRHDELFEIRKNGQVLSLHKGEAEARQKLYVVTEKAKGGKNEMKDATQEQSGLEAARKQAEKLRAEVEEKKDEEKKEMEVAKTQLEMVRQNATLSKMFEEESKKEMKDSLGSQPLLKLHVVGRSNNELLDGSQPEDGSFFYTPTQEAFKNPLIHVLVMSEGFYAEGVPDDDGKRKIGYNILLGGTIVAEGENMRPFLMYIRSNSTRQSFWDFRNEFSKYARLMRVPKSALTVRMTREKVPNPNPKWAKMNPTVNNIKFSIEKFADGTPALITNEEDFSALVDIQAMLKEMVESIIAEKRVEKPLDDRQGNATPKNDVVEGELANENTSSEDIPF